MYLMKMKLLQIVWWGQEMSDELVPDSNEFFLGSVGSGFYQLEMTAQGLAEMGCLQNKVV